MTLKLRTVLGIAACLAITGCSQSADVHFVTGSQVAQVSITPSPAAPGTLILSDTDYSYTPLGGSPTGYQNYTDAPIRIAVGTSIAVDLYVTPTRPVSSNPRVVKQLGEHSKRRIRQRRGAVQGAASRHRRHQRGGVLPQDQHPALLWTVQRHPQRFLAPTNPCMVRLLPTQK